ncbi:MAG: flagellar biosynthesis protein FlhF [bacterium]|jgi:flagellar biosynthesis protein FlhF|nr:flagellar biosynthesis protein FlhF [candidate division KSB1 bacterium]MDH7559327.1 flagellar biosynthesis protein FlhF [bacterium]
MIVKRYRARSVHRALAQVKAELGENAVILKTYKVPKQGILSCLYPEEVEVVAAIEDPAKAAQLHQKQEGSSPRDRCQSFDRFMSLSAELCLQVDSGNGAPGRNAVNRPESGAAPQQARSVQRPLVPDSVLARERTALVRSGVHPRIAARLVRTAAYTLGGDEPASCERLRERILLQIAGLIRTAGPLNCRSGTPKVVAFVGPTGVGKTTTLAKLAVSGKYHYKKKIALISADTYRMAALEHLNTFAGIAQLPMSAVYTPEELRAAIDSHRACDLILIDTAGRGQSDEEHIAELKQILQAVQGVEVHLVLPANMKGADLVANARRFDALPVHNLIVTKVDETRTLGSLLNVLGKIGKPISYITTGQSIPEDIELANPQRLARMMVRW